jgi:hypothetical protein
MVLAIPIHEVFMHLAGAVKGAWVEAEMVPLTLRESRNAILSSISGPFGPFV